MEQSSTWRNLFLLHAFYTSRQTEALRGKTILNLCDNAGVTSIIRKGSTRAALAKMSRDIFLACKSLDIELIVNWESWEAEVMSMAALGAGAPGWLRTNSRWTSALTLHPVKVHTYSQFLNWLSSYLNLVCHETVSVSL